VPARRGAGRLHIILKLANGRWLISDQSDGESLDWRVREFNVQDLRWRVLEIKEVVEGAWARKPDLMPGGASDACSRVDWMEVWGKAAPRDGRTAARRVRP
jgi:hypothetical protein